jgi:transcriptional regulator with XRE-family HTH domain
MKTSEPKTHRNLQVAEMRSHLSRATLSKSKKAMSLAAKIEDAITEHRLSKKAFAGLLNVQPSVVSKWLSGTHNFTIDTLFDIEECLQVELVSVNVFFNEPFTIRMAMVIGSGQPSEVSSEPLWNRIEFKHGGTHFWDNSINSAHILNVYNTIRKITEHVSFIENRRCTDPKEKYYDR